jgi:hypothetical protein
MSKARQASSFDLAVEQARLEYLASSGQQAGTITGVKTKLVEPLVNRRKPRVYSSPNVTKATGTFYDLEFCLWLQHNFDNLLAHHREFPGFKLYQGVAE